MFKSKKSTSNVSPLQPPPASTNPYPQFPQQLRGPPGQFSPTDNNPQQFPGLTDRRDRRLSAPLSGVPYHMQDQYVPNGHGPDQGSMRGRPMSAGAGQTLAVPSPVDLQRVSTGGTTGSTNSKKEKRRSGFFGFGKKDKDKDRDSRDRPTSFSVGRPSGDAPAFSRHTMSSIPSQLSQSTQPFEDFTGSGGPEFENSTSQPAQAPTPNEFGGHDGRYPKSQSMAFGGRGGRDAPQTFNGRPDGVQGNNQMSKSQSMPFNRYNEWGTGNAQPRDGNQGPTVQGSRGYGGIQEEEAPAPIDKTPKQSPRLPPGPGTSPRQPPAAATNGLADGKMQNFDQVVELIAAQPQKTYVASPPELEMILARTSAGGQPKQGQPGSASNDWDSVWLQLSGISLSMWSMKETRAAAAKGEKVPPTYFNITDSSLELLAPLPPPPHRPKSHPHHFVFSLNTAGSNRLLFSCPSERDMAKWATGLRLAAWERARLEEIYTGHLIKSEGLSEAPSQLSRGRMEGWVRARVMGGTDWKRLWVVLSTPEVPKDDAAEKKNRRRSIFGIGETKEKDVVQEPNTGQKMASFYLEPRTQKNQTSNVPVLTITNVSQAYAVFPERLEVMSQSNLMKVVGRVNGELVTIEGRLRDSGWALIMPETPETANGGPPPPQSSPLTNMLRWVTGFHDVFELYGRPAGYNWDIKDPKSLFFAYPRGENRSRLFLDLDEGLRSDFRTSNLAQIRASFASLLQQRMNGPDAQYKPEDESAGTTPRPDNNSYRLPPLSFDKSGAVPANGQAPPEPRSLTPITERTDIASRNPSQRTEKSQFFMSEATSTAQHRQVSKQTSGGSSKHTGSIGDDRLATISDSNETPSSQITETQAVTSPVQNLSRRGTDQSQAAPTPATYQSQSSNWSQSSAATPAQRAPTPPGDDADSSEAFHTPQPGPTSTVPSSSERDLPDLPGSWNPPAKTGSPLPKTDAGPPLAAALPAAPAPVLSPTPRRGSVEPTSAGSSGYEQAAAAYLANVVENKGQPGQKFQRSPEASHTPLDMQRLSDEKTRPTIITQLDNHERRPSSGPDLGRRPSGARPLPVKSDSTSSSRILKPTAEAVENESGDTLKSLPVNSQGHRPERLASTSSVSDLGEDAANFMAYAEQPSPAKAPPVIPPIVAAPALRPEEDFRSSFAPSKAATERKAQADQAAAAKTLPGAGKRTGGASGAWSDGSDEEEEEESEDESEVVNGKGKGKSVAPSLPPLPLHTQQEYQNDQAPVQRVLSQTRALPAIPRSNGDAQTPTLRDYERPRTMSGPDRNITRSRSPTAPLPQPPAIFPQQAPPPASRQTIWNANFSADHGLDAPKSGKFVDIDEPAQLTKAFAPHGLLQAGMQDKEDRSAKKQEELARELGSSLVHVPEKPPPPQTGLLGAVAQHEKERKNAGGIGATITDRERERRLAEDRQREIEKLQRQQMEHMRSFGGEGNMGMYGGSQQFPPYMNMGMMGMPPMGYNPSQPYQSGYNPYAQQQAMMAAQMAYQQAMMSYGPPPNQGGYQGSQAGDHERPSSPSSVSNQPHSTAQSPSGQPYPFFQGYGGWPGMHPMPMGWGTPSPPPNGSMPPWMQNPGFASPGGGMSGFPTSPNLQAQGYGQDGRDTRSQISGDRSRVQSMISEGQGSNQGFHPS